jgi:SAM-dependent methyltransferase
MTDFKFACPRCGAPLDSTLICPTCKAVFECRDGIYRFLLHERELELKPFLRQYQHVRQQEGNLAQPAEYYRSLPSVSRGHPEAERWHIRRQSFECLLGLLPKHPIKILDLGAGNCWLTNRLTALGHHCVAVDVSTSCDDGLGAREHYTSQFTCVQADFDSLPFVPGQFDAAMFDASLHYSPDVHRSLEQVNLMIRQKGMIFVIDSPTFRNHRSGRQMVHERDEHFKKGFGLQEVIQRGPGYLTRRQMHSAGFQFHASHGRLLWSVRRLWSGIKMQREPAAFGVWMGQSH